MKFWNKATFFLLFSPIKKERAYCPLLFERISYFLTDSLLLSLLDLFFLQKKYCRQTADNIFHPYNQDFLCYFFSFSADDINGQTGNNQGNAGDLGCPKGANHQTIGS